MRHLLKFGVVYVLHTLLLPTTNKVRQQSAINSKSAKEDHILRQKRLKFFITNSVS